MANSGPLLTKTVVEKHAKDAREAKAADPYSQRLTQGYQTQGQSSQVRLLAAYQTLRSALVSSTATSPETFRQAQQEVRNDQRKRSPDKKIRSISVKQIDDRIVQLQQEVVLQNVQQTASGTVYNAKEPNQDKAGKQQEQEALTPPELEQKTISLEAEEESAAVAELNETQAEPEAAEAESDAPPSENKPSLPPISPQKMPQPIRDEYISESQLNNQPPHVVSQALPQGPSGLKAQVEMMQMFNQAKSSNMAGGLIRDITTSTQELISGFSGGSMGPGAMIPNASMASGGAPAGGLPGSAAQGAKSLASQVPKVAGPALNALKALASKGALTALLGNPIALTVIGIVVVLIILVVISSGGGGNVANLVPTNEFLPLGTGEGQANPNALYGDAVPINVENPCWPTSGTISQLPNTGHGTWCGNDGVGVAFHQAIDIANPASVPVYTPFAGEVCVMTQTQMGDNGKLEGYGKYVAVCTNEGFDMVFAHLLAFAPGLQQGATVTKGQQIGVMGNTGDSTGNHLHFEITNLTVCRPYNITDILPNNPALQSGVTYINQSCSQYSQTGGQNVPL